LIPSSGWSISRTGRPGRSTCWTFLRAASLYRNLRRKGATVNSFDTTIAAVCLENYLPLLTSNRRDFAPIARYAGLKLA